MKETAIKKMKVTDKGKQNKHDQVSKSHWHYGQTQPKVQATYPRERNEAEQGILRLVQLSAIIVCLLAGSINWPIRLLIDDLAGGPRRAEALRG
jgi:hypothetical protein